MERKKTRKQIKKTSVLFGVVFGALILYTALMFALLLLGLNTSLKHFNDYSIDNNIFGLPNMEWWRLDRYYKNNIFGNYLFVFEHLKVEKGDSYIIGWFNKERVHISIEVGILEATLNTVMYAVGGSLVATFMPMFMGYLCAKYKNKASALIYAVVLIVIATPIVGNTPATVNFMRKLRLYDTFIGDLLRKASFTNMYFLIFHAYFSSLAKSYDEAAEIDGASQLTVMFRICLPLAMNIFWTVFLILFVSFWNDFTNPMMFIPNKPTLSYLIYYCTTYMSGTEFNLPTRRIAALMLFAVPIIIIFCIFNKRLMSNMTMGGIKE